MILIDLITYGGVISPTNEEMTDSTLTRYARYDPYIGNYS